MAGEIQLIAKIAPKGEAFTGLMDAKQLIGGAENKLPDAAVSLNNVSQHISSIAVTAHQVAPLGDRGKFLRANQDTGAIEWATASVSGDHGELSGLGDDDHTQYHNDARATTWLATKAQETPAASKIPIANSSGYLLSGWFNPAPATYAFDPLMPATTASWHTALGDPTVLEMALIRSCSFDATHGKLPTTLEYTYNGTDWTSFTSPERTAVQNAFCVDNLWANLLIKNSGSDPNGAWQKFRMVWDAHDWDVQYWLRFFYLYCSTNHHTIAGKIESSQDGSAWGTVWESGANTSGSPRHITISHTAIPWYYQSAPLVDWKRYVRVTITPTWDVNYPNENIEINHIKWIAVQPASNTTDRPFIMAYNNELTFKGSLYTPTGSSLGIGITSDLADVVHIKRDTNNTAVGVMVDNQYQRLRLQSFCNNGVASYSTIQSISTAGVVKKLLLNPDGGSVGIGAVTDPTDSLEIVKPTDSAIGQLKLAYNSNWQLRFVQNYVSAADIKYELHQIYNGSDSIALGLKAGLVGVGNSTPLAGVDVTAASTCGNAKFGSTLPAYVSSNHPYLGLNTYYNNSAWKFGAGSSSNYAAYIGFAPTTGLLSIGSTAATGNADDTATMTTRISIDKDGGVTSQTMTVSSLTGSKLVTTDANKKLVSSEQTAIDHGSISGLSDDDHTSYHTDARANTWLATKAQETPAAAKIPISNASGYLEANWLNPTPATYSIDAIAPTSTSLWHSTLDSPTTMELALIKNYTFDATHGKVPTLLEYTRNGTDWISFTAGEKTAAQNVFCVDDLFTSIIIKNSTSDPSGAWVKFRMKWDAHEWDVSYFLRFLYMYMQTNHHTTALLIEKSKDDAAWDTVYQSASNISGSPRHVMVRHPTIEWYYNDANRWRYVRVTLTPTWDAGYPAENITLLHYRWMSTIPASNTTDRPFTMGYTRDLTFYGDLLVPTAKGVAVGRTTRDDALHVELGTNATRTGIICENQGQRLRLQAYNDLGVSQYSVIQAVTSSATANNLMLQPDGGKIAIGTTTAPTCLVHILGGDKAYSGMIGALGVSGDSFAKRINIGMDCSGTEYGWIQASNGGSSRRLRLQPYGNCGVGANDPAYKLDVYLDGTDNSFPLRVFNDGNNALRHGVYIQCGADDASGTTKYIYCVDGDGGEVGYIENNSGTFRIVDSCDERLKENIAPTKVKGLETLLRIQPIEFSYQKQGLPEADHLCGFSAQNIREVFPEASAEGIPTEEDGIAYYGVSRLELLPLMVVAIKEADAKIETLKATVASQQGTISAQQATLEALVARVAALESRAV